MHPTLPIFEIPWDNKIIIYSPGKFFVTKREHQNTISKLLLEHDNIVSSYLRKEVTQIKENTQTVTNVWNNFKNQQFAPECLTVYISNDCNLNCNYCYSRVNKKTGRNRVIDLESVLIAAKIIGENCKQLNKPFTLVLHGGGEPTFHWKLFVEIFEKVKQVTKKMGIAFFSYVATNGEIGTEKAKWLSKNISLIGLSCDGPPDINIVQRKGSSNVRVEETARIINSEGGKYDVRSTITKNTITKQKIITDYLIRELKATRIRFEPEYQNLVTPFLEEDATIFVENFLLAEELATKNGAELAYSGVRINEIHNSYCDINRNTLRINPENQIINCFCDTEEFKYPFGSIDLTSKNILFKNISKLKGKAYSIKNECLNCINIYHCSRGCPDHCNLSEKSELNKFRCQVNIQLAIEFIKRKASTSSTTNMI